MACTYIGDQAGGDGWQPSASAGAAGFVGGKIIFSGGKNNGFFSDTYIGTFI